MKCSIPDQAFEIVMRYLRWRGQTLILSGEGFSLIEGKPDLKIIEVACDCRAITINASCNIRICEVVVDTRWDKDKIRRKVEEYLRKEASAKEIICVAGCLGVLK